MKVQDPQGQTWRASRRWVPWRRRLKGAWQFLDWFPSHHLGNDPVSSIIFVVLLIIAIPFLLIAFIASLELLLVLLVLPFAILGRVVLGRHWTVELRRGWTPWYEEEAGDWQASGIAIHALADRVRHGDLPERTIDPGPVDDVTS